MKLCVCLFMLIFLCWSQQLQGCFGPAEEGRQPSRTELAEGTEALTAEECNCPEISSKAQGCLCQEEPKSVAGPPLLYLGPGGDDEGVDAEVFSLKDEDGNQKYTLTQTSCYIPPYQKDYSTGGVGFVLQGVLVHCGGYDGRPLSSCNSLINFAWTETTPMLSLRYGADAVVLPNATVIVSGGYGINPDYSSVYHDTTEIYDGSVWRTGIDLPTGMAHHCMEILPNGNLFIAGGYSGGSGGLAGTYTLNMETEVWTSKANMSQGRDFHACAVFKGEVWVGGSVGSQSVEIYNPETNKWRLGLRLPYGAQFPGEFIIHGNALLYAGGYRRNDIYQINIEGDGWMFLRKMNHSKRNFPALMISEAECYGVTYSDDGVTGRVSGSLLDVLNILAETSLDEIIVRCCKNGVHFSNKTCGNGTSCANICGQNNQGFAALAITSAATDAEICSDTNTIKFVSNIPVYKLGFCPHRVKSVKQLNHFKICCLHPMVYRRPGVKTRCCQFGLCV